MYQYTEFDRQFVRERAAQFRDQLDRFHAGTLGGDEFKPLRLQNGWYIQRHAPMLRVAVPYGELSTAQVRRLANRHTGIGFDQLIVIEPSNIADVRLRFWNSDGGEVSACGNGSRAAATLLGGHHHLHKRDGSLEGQIIIFVHDVESLRILLITEVEHRTVQIGTLAKSEWNFLPAS